MKYILAGAVFCLLFFAIRLTHGVGRSMYEKKEIDKRQRAVSYTGMAISLLALLAALTYMLRDY